MQRIRLLKAVTTCAIAIGLFGCNPAKEIAKAIEVETKEQELTYSITATQNLSDETYEETMGSHTLWNCVTEYCTSMHDPFANGMLRRYTNNQPDQYVNYRKYLCAADLLMDIVNGVKPVTLSMSPESLLTTAAIENFNFTLGSTDSCGENRPQPGATTTISLSDAFQIEFSPLETVNQREDVRRMAYIYYYAAVDQILELAKAQEQLAFLVEEVEDTWFSSTHPTSYLGATLAKQMFASTSTIISQMIDMKTADAEERYHQGITKQDAWFSSEYGRVPAIAHLAGAINIDDRYIASPDGTTYWTRCRVGQTWNGSTCEGSHSTFKWDEAADACDSDKGERLPTLDEYFEILNDSVVFCAPSGTSGTCSCTNCTGDNGVCGASSICSAMFGNDKQHYFTELHGTDWRVAMDLDDQGWSRKYEHHADRPVRCVVSVHDLWSRPHMDLLPNNNAPLPKMTNSLAGAVSLLNNNKINFPCFAREIPGEVDPYDSCTQEELENILRTRVNDRLVSLDQAPLSSTDIWSKKGTTEGDLVQAAKYMYSHLILYPRETNYTEASDEHFDPEFEFEGWKNSFVSLPTQYRVRDIDKTWLESYPLESPMDMNDMVAYVGLMPLLQSLRYSILDSTEALSDIPDAGVADGDKYVGFLDDTMDYIRAQTGKSYVHYKWDNSTDLTVYYHHPVILSEPPDTVATHLRIYPIGDVESPNQFDNFVCMQLDPNCDVAYHDIALNSCDMSPEPDGGTDWEPREPYCVGELTGLDDSVVQWMVEMNQSESSDIGQWKPIGVLRAESEGAQGDLSFSGNIMGMLSIFTGFNSDSLNSEPCVSIGGIDRPCVPRNWVPAIDNELIDPSGNQYEESYRHYLGLARSAASKAKSLREDLINDVIQREHEEGMQAAKLEEALHAYSSEVQNICGDKFQKEAFDIKVREIYVDQGSSESFADRVKSEYPYFVDYGCLYENGDPYEGHERVKNSRPLHCSVDRRCSPVELWELGVFSEVGRHAPSYDGSADWNEQPSFEPEPEELFIPIMDEQTVLETIGLTATGVGPGSKSGPGQTFGHPSEQFTNPATSAQAVEFGNQLLSAAKQGGLFNLQSMEMLPMDRERFPYNDVPNFPENARTWNTKCSDYDFSVTTMPEWPDCTMYQGTMYDCVIEALWQMRCWAENHRTFAQTFIEKHKVRAIPKIFDMSGQNLYEIQLERELANLGNNYGRYYDALHDIASAITEMKSAAASYIYEVDNAIMNIDAIKNAINLAKNEKDLMIAMQLANAQTAGVMYEHQFRATAELCIDGKTNAKNPNGVAHVDAIEGALLSMENELGSQENWNTWWGSMQENVLKANIDKEYFVNYCINTKTITDPTFNSFKNIICGYVGDTYWGKQSWHRTGAFYPSNDGPIDGELAFYTHFEKKGQNYLTEICPISNHFFENTYCPCRRNGDDGVVFKALCLDHKEDANAKCISGFNWVDDICRNDGGYGLSVSGISKTEIATEIQKLIMKKLYSECDIGDYSCDITIPEMKTVVEEATVGNCTGIGANASTELDQNIEDWEEDGDMWKLAQSGSIFQQKSGADDLVSTMIQVGHNLATQKARLAIAIRDLSVKSAKLNLLETEQDNLFQKAVNDKNSAEAASYANLAEWQERYNFKVDEYHDQLKRARYSAWVARRAIEFRLGIDLSMEVTETPYGDKPSDWADEIYTTYTSTCGLQEIDGNEVEIAEGDSNITACLSQENLIEKYVQKLDDYVEAYGNSGWWFHEDDDTGVISIRDNVAVTNVDCTTQVYNLLNFTEEIGLTGDERDTVYNGYYDDVSAWTRSPEITLTENREDMGIPFDIMASHFTNEYGVFEDQMEQNTGDVLKASPGVEVEISQEVDIEFAQDAGQSENYEFSMYLRKNPESRDCDEGEEYFAEIGKCGVPCELQIEDDQVVDMYGDCNESDTPEGSKQVCMYAGVGPTEEGVYARRRMCNWCTADRGCIFQDGEVVTLSIEDEITVNRNVSQVNATAYSFWNRQHVNNVDYLIYTGPPPPLPDDGDGDGDGDGADDSEGNTPTISVHLKNTVTKNLINSSERVDTEMGWIMGPGTSVNGRVPSPDGAEHGAYELSYPSSFSIETQEEIEDVSYHTGSIWMKVPGGTSSDDEGGGVVTITLAKENGDLISENLGVSLDTQWKRYEIHGKTEFITTKLVMSITQETYFEKIHVWGAQIEKGIGTTTYIPTGKNI
ncbi:MAG: hypothetical protein GY847_36230 [Proteobacteria bacterium]|nr:hypothetical protein [Pseudomonadota bacterium]